MNRAFDGPRIAVPAPPESARCETVDADGCRVTLRRFDGPLAVELFLHASPLELRTASVSEQTGGLYRALRSALKRSGTDFGGVVSESVFLRTRADAQAVREVRARVVPRDAPLVGHRPMSEVEQPPLDSAAHLEVSLQALVPNEGELDARVVVSDSDAGCGEAFGLRVALGEEVRLYAGGLVGPGKGAEAQTGGMFSAAESLLEGAGLAFADIVRTWIHIADIGRDYDAFNRARRAYFAARAVDPIPASTGIGGAPASNAHALCLGFYAVRAAGDRKLTVMTSPTLNEAPQYGADFVRGMKMVESNKVALHVSGTASVDEAGRTAHVGDFGAQADRMLVNIAALLDGQGAGFEDIVSGVAYLADPKNAERLRVRFEVAGFGDFPLACVEATVCRSDLLCETEVLAVLPRC